MCAQNNLDNRKLGFLEKECEKTENNKITEIILDGIYASIKQVSSTTTALDDTCERNDFDIIGNLEKLQRYLFFCEKENTRLKRLQKLRFSCS